MAARAEEDRIKAHKTKLDEAKDRLEEVLEKANKILYSNRDYIARSMRKGLIVNPNPRKSRRNFDLRDLNKDLWMK